MSGRTGCGRVSGRVLGAATVLAGVLAGAVAAPPAEAAVVTKVVSVNTAALAIDLSTAGKDGKVTFSGLTGQVVKVATSAGTFAANCDVNVSLLKGATTLVPAFCGGQAGVSADFSLPSNATYTVLVDPVGSAAGIVSVAVTSGAGPQSVTPNDVNPLAGSVPAGSSLDLGTIGVANQVFTLKTAAGAPDCTLSATFRNPGGADIGADTCAGVAGFIDRMPSAAGKHSVHLTNTAATAKSVTVEVFQFKDKDAGAIVADGAPVLLKTASPGQFAFAGFAATIGQSYTLELTASTAFPQGATVYLRRPDGSTTCPCIGVPGGGLSSPFGIDQDGTWQVLVDGNGSGTGSATLLLRTSATIDGGTIVANGPAMTITFTTPGTDGFFTFPGTLGQQISYEVIDVTGSLVDQGGSVILSRPDESGTCPCAAFGAGSFADSFTLDAAGTWKIKIDPSGTGTGSVTIKLYSFADVNAGAIVPNGAAKTITTTSPGQNGFVTFTGSVGQKVAFEVTASSGSIVTTTGGTVLLQRPDGSSTCACTGVGAGSFGDATTLDAAGTWRILLDPSGTGTGSVTLKLYTFSDVDGGAITAGGAAKSLSVTTPGQNGFFTFTGAVGQKVAFEVTASSGSMVTTTGGSVLLADPSGNLRCACTGVGAGSFGDNTTLDAAGTWKVIVDPSDVGTGSISLKLYSVPDVDAGAIVANGAAKTITTTSPGQNGFVTFTGSVGQKVAFEVTASSGSIVTTTGGTVLLQRPDGSSTCACTGVGAGSFGDATTLDAAGTWRILLDPSGTGTGSVTLKLYTFSDVDGGAITAGGAAKSVTTTIPGQNAFFTFTGTAGQMRSLLVQTASGFPSGGSGFLQGPSGATTCPCVSLVTGSSAGPGSLFESGTWKIIVDPSGTGVGSATFKLT